MYHTPDGDRILLGAERRLFVESLAALVDLLATDADDDIILNVISFDELQPNQRLLVLYRSARGLLRPDEPPPKLTAFIDSAVATVYEFAKAQVEQEIDAAEFSEEVTSWRRLILAAAQQQSVSGELPDDTNEDMQVWGELIEDLAGRVLWDYDFALQDSLDLPPEESKRLRSVLGVADGYYTDVPDDPPDDQRNLYLEALMGLTADAR